MIHEVHFRLTLEKTSRLGGKQAGPQGGAPGLLDIWSCEGTQARVADARAWWFAELQVSFLEASRFAQEQAGRAVWAQDRTRHIATLSGLCLFIVLNTRRDFNNAVLSAF